MPIASFGEFTYRWLVGKGTWEGVLVCMCEGTGTLRAKDWKAMVSKRQQWLSVIDESLTIFHIIAWT